jgi:hypothetical protein
MTKTVYRYDDEDYPDGQLVRSRGDSFDILTKVEKVVELGIRALLPDGANVRGASLYTWEDEVVARRLWKLSGKKYLYELEVDDASIRHIGDLNLYSCAKDAVQSGQSPNEAISAYCNRDVADPKLGGPRREILVSEGRIIPQNAKAPGGVPPSAPLLRRASFQAGSRTPVSVQVAKPAWLKRFADSFCLIRRLNRVAHPLLGCRICFGALRPAEYLPSQASEVFNLTPSIRRPLSPPDVSAYTPLLFQRQLRFSSTVQSRLSPCFSLVRLWQARLPRT